MKKKKNKKKKNYFQQYLDKYDTGGPVHNHPHDNQQIIPNPNQQTFGQMNTFGNKPIPQRPFYGQNAMVPGSQSQFDLNNITGFDNVNSLSNQDYINQGQKEAEDLENLFAQNNINYSIDEFAAFTTVPDTSRKKYDPIGIEPINVRTQQQNEIGGLFNEKVKGVDEPSNKSFSKETTSILGEGESGGGMDMGAMGGAMAGITDNINQTFQFIESMKSLGQFSTRPGVYSENTGTKFALGGLTQNPTIEVEGEEVIETPDGQLLEAKGPSHEQGGIVTNDVPAGSMVYSDAVKKAGKSMAARKLGREKSWSAIAEKAMADPQNAILIESMARILEKNKLADEEDKKLMEAARQDDERKTSANNLLSKYLGLNEAVNQATSKLSANPTKYKNNKEYKKGGKVDYKYKTGGIVEGDPLKNNTVDPKDKQNLDNDSQLLKYLNTATGKKQGFIENTSEGRETLYNKFFKPKTIWKNNERIPRPNYETWQKTIPDYSDDNPKTVADLQLLAEKMCLYDEDCVSSEKKEAVDDVDNIAPINAQKRKVIYTGKMSKTGLAKFKKTGLTLEEYANKRASTTSGRLGRDSYATEEYKTGGEIEEDPPKLSDLSKIKSTAVVNPNFKESRKSGLNMMDLLDSDREKNLYDDKFNIGVTPSSEEVDSPLVGENEKTIKRTGFSSEFGYDNQGLNFTGEFNPNYANGKFVNPNIGGKLEYKGLTAGLKTDTQGSDLINLGYSNPNANINYEDNLQGIRNLKAGANYKGLSAKLDTDFKDEHNLALTGNYNDNTKGYLNSNLLDEHSFGASFKGNKGLGAGVDFDYDDKGLVKYNLQTGVGPFTAGYSNTREGNQNLSLKGAGKYGDKYGGFNFNSDVNYDFQGNPTLTGAAGYEGKDSSASFETDTDFNERLKLATAAKYKSLGFDATGNFNKQGLSDYDIGAKLGPLSGRVTGDSEKNTNVDINFENKQLLDLLKFNYNQDINNEQLGKWNAGLEAKHKIGKTDMRGKITTDNEGNWNLNSGADIGFGNKGKVSPSINATPEQVELALSSNIPINDKLALLASVNANTKGDWSVEGGVESKLNDMLNLKATMGYDSNKGASGNIGLQALLNQQKRTPNPKFAAKKYGGVVKYTDGGPVLPASEYKDADAVIKNIFKGDKLAYQKAVNAYIDKNKIADLVGDESGKSYTNVGEDKIIGDKSTSFLRSKYGKDFLESKTGFKTINYNSGYPEGASPFLTGNLDTEYNPYDEGYFYDDRRLENIEGAGLYDPSKLQYKQYSDTEFDEGEGLFRTFPEDTSTQEGKPWATDWADYMLNPSTKNPPKPLKKGEEEEPYDPETPEANWTQGDLTGMAGTMMGGLSPMMTTMMQQAATPKNTSFYETYMNRALGTMEGQKGFLGQQKSKALRDVTIASDTFDRKSRRDARSINTLRALGQVSNAQEQKMVADVYSKYAQQMMGLTGQIAQMQGQQDMMKMQGREKADLANRQDTDAFFTNINADQRNLGTMLQKMGKDLNVKQSDVDFLSILPDLNKYGINMRKKKGGGYEMFDSKTGRTAKQSKLKELAKKIAADKAKAETNTGE